MAEQDGKTKARLLRCRLLSLSDERSENLAVDGIRLLSKSAYLGATKEPSHEQPDLLVTSEPRTIVESPRQIDEAETGIELRSRAPFNVEEIGQIQHARFGLACADTQRVAEVVELSLGRAGSPYGLGTHDVYRARRGRAHSLRGRPVRPGFV